MMYLTKAPVQIKIHILASMFVAQMVGYKELVTLPTKTALSGVSPDIMLSLGCIRKTISDIVAIDPAKNVARPTLQFGMNVATSINNPLKGLLTKTTCPTDLKSTLKK